MEVFTEKVSFTIRAAKEMNGSFRQVSSGVQVVSAVAVNFYDKLNTKFTIILATLYGHEDPLGPVI